jgi:hypothetical protein
MRKDYSPGVLKAAPKSTSELEARDKFNREHPPIQGLAAHDLNLDPSDTARYLAVQDTGLLRTMRLHQIEQHPVQLSPEEARKPLEARAARHGQVGA